MMVFSEQWFKQHQWWLLPYVSRNRDNLFIETNKPLVEIAPDHVTWQEEKGLYSTEFHVHHVYGRRLYTRLSPLWNLMHRIDMSTFGRSVGLNFGFDTLTAYPDAHPETDTVDGVIEYTSSGVSWATMHDASSGGSVYDQNTSGDFVIIYSASVSSQWRNLRRSFFLFNTSALGSEATISAATFSFYQYSMGVTDFGTTTINLVASTPASNTGLVADDYDQLGTTSFGTKSGTSSGYNGITLNASGISNISKTGISKFGCRSEWDRADSRPTWEKNLISSESCYFADDTTANNGKDPKLVVTYTAQSFVPKIWFM